MPMLMLALSYAANILILIPLLISFSRRAATIDAAYGADTEARRILACIYAAILGMSALGVALILLGHVTQAIALAVALFSLQIVYKVLTVPALGLSNPVVQSNVAIAGLHSVTLTMVLTA